MERKTMMTEEDFEKAEEAIASCVRYLMTNEIGFPTTYDRDIFLRAARAYAELQKGV
jgi:hypothetical protein